MGIEIELRGPDRFPELAAAFGPAVSDIVGKATYDLLARTQHTSPFREGNLKASHQARYRQGETRGELYVGAHYAGYQEFGTTHGVPARRWVRDAVDVVQPAMVAMLGRLEERL